MKILRLPVILAAHLVEGLGIALSVIGDDIETIFVETKEDLLEKIERAEKEILSRYSRETPPLDLASFEGLGKYRSQVSASHHLQSLDRWKAQLKSSMGNQRRVRVHISRRLSDTKKFIRNHQT